MKIIHIFDDNQSQKFYEPYIDFINNNFDKADHYFYILGKQSEKYKIKDENVHFISGIGYFKLFVEMANSKIIIIHKLYNPEFVFLLSLQSWLKKSRWVIWGVDLYHNFEENSLKLKLYNKLRKFTIKHIGGIISFQKGDYNLAKVKYGARGKYYSCFMYTTNLFKERNIARSNDVYKFVVQVGNSADPTNNHLEIFKKLSKFKSKNLEILCPLSYGDELYKKQVISVGKEIFGEKFKPLVQFISYDEYLEVLEKVDAVIYGHQRQQGMGNLIPLLGYGKKVYIRDDITSWELFAGLGLKIFKSNSDLDDLLIGMTEYDITKNIKIMKEVFSESRLIEDLSKIFANE